jgi:hypothetical protein
MGIPIAEKACDSSTFEDNIDYLQDGSIRKDNVKTAADCCDICKKSNDCTHFSWTKLEKQCYLKQSD